MGLHRRVIYRDEIADRRFDHYVDLYAIEKLQRRAVLRDVVGAVRTYLFLQVGIQGRNLLHHVVESFRAGNSEKQS